MIADDLGRPRGGITAVRVQLDDDVRMTEAQHRTSVLAYVAQGLTDEEIAKELSLSVGQVRYQVRGAIQWIGARNRANAVARAIAAGFLIAEEPHR
jgi:DNA-binding NarL/FixJ family response regulator